MIRVLLFVFVTFPVIHAFSQNQLNLFTNYGKDSSVVYKHFDYQKNLIILGTYRKSVITLGDHTFTNAGEMDLFIVKYDILNHIVWAKCFGGKGNDYVTGMRTDTKGTIFVSGLFESSTISFDSITLSNSGGYSVFNLELDSQGTILSAKSIEIKKSHLEFSNYVHDFIIFTNKLCRFLITIGSLSNIK